MTAPIFVASPFGATPEYAEQFVKALAQNGRVELDGTTKSVTDIEVNSDAQVVTTLYKSITVSARTSDGERLVWQFDMPEESETASKEWDWREEQKAGE